jgi:hypothetical protein
MIFNCEDNQWDEALCNTVRDWFNIMDTLVLKRRVYVLWHISARETESGVEVTLLNVIFSFSAHRQSVIG